MGFGGINPPPTTPRPDFNPPPQKMKPKQNNKGGALDNCYTPPHALLPITHHLLRGPKQEIWESAPGELFMVEAICNQLPGVVVTYGDKDFFTWQPDRWSMQITNPPYSRKFEWLRRSYALGKPFALLLPVESIGAKQGNTLIAEFGAEFILFTKRINFHMPNKGYEGSAQFPVLWWTYGLNLGKQIKVWDIDQEMFLT